MNPFEIILGVVIMILSVAISILVLMQSGKDKKLSGAIAGGSDSFYSRSKAGKKDELLSKITMILSIALGVFIVVMYVFF